MSQIKAILFDLDGTVNDTVTDLAVSVNYALNKNGLPTHPVDSYKLFAGNGMRIMVQRAMPDDQKEGTLYEQVVADYAAYYALHSMDNTKPYDGVCELLDELRSMGYLTAVVTNKPHVQAVPLIAQMLPDKFDVVIGQQEGVPSKPDPAMPLMAMKQLGVTPEECVFVGDSGVDILTGLNSGAYPVGVLWGFRGREELLQNGAKELISKPCQLIDILKRR